MASTPARFTVRVGAVIFAAFYFGQILWEIQEVGISWVLAPLAGQPDIFIYHAPKIIMYFVVAVVVAWMAIRLGSGPLPAIGTLFISTAALIGALHSFYWTWNHAQMSQMAIRPDIWIRVSIPLLAALLMVAGSLAPLLRRHIKSRLANKSSAG